MENYRNLGRLLLLNLVSNCDFFSSKNNAEYNQKDDFMRNLSDKELYSRLYYANKFDEMKPDKKELFLFGLNQSCCQEVEFDNTINRLLQEAHNRACKSLGCEPTQVDYNILNNNRRMNSCFMVESIFNKILFNWNFSRENVMPAWELLRQINMVSKEKSNYSNVFKIIKDPNSVSDKDFFLATFVAVKQYLLREALKEKDDDFLSFYQETADFSPDNIYNVLYSLSKTRKDLSENNLYDKRNQKEIRRDEEGVYNDVASFSGFKMIDNALTLFSFFKNSNLNKNSNNFLMKCLESVEKSCSSAFFKDFGINIPQNVDIEEFYNDVYRQSLSLPQITVNGQSYILDDPIGFDEKGQPNVEQIQEYIAQNFELFADAFGEDDKLRIGAISKVSFPILPNKCPEDFETNKIIDDPFNVCSDAQEQ